MTSSKPGKKIADVIRRLDMPPIRKQDMLPIRKRGMLPIHRAGMLLTIIRLDTTRLDTTQTLADLCTQNRDGANDIFST